MVTDAAAGALRGILVLDVGTQTPGKLAAHLLGELGANVVRIERPSTEPVAVSDEDLLLNRGKRSLALDLGDPAGRKALERLLARADVLLHTYRPSTAARLGLDGARALERNPRLVLCALSGFGAAGGAGERPAYDLLVLAATGMLHALFGRRDAPVPGAYLSDAVSGVVAAFAVVTALFTRERDGGGRALDLAMADAVFGLLAASHGTRRDGPFAATLASPLYATYACGDGGAVALAVLRRASCEALFRELGQPALADVAWRGAEATAVADFLGAAFRTRPAHEWVERLAKLDIEIAEVRSVYEAFEDPVLRARHMAHTLTHPSAGTLVQIGHALQAGGAPLARASAASAGTDADAILRELETAAGR
jgi:crotonobetainyl-CoA:carnitine CoA-transferase CaiB-like acyl-CoA transferase